MKRRTDRQRPRRLPGRVSENQIELAIAEQLLTCPDCGQHGFSARGLSAHRGTKHCRRRGQEIADALESGPLFFRGKAVPDGDV